MSNYLKVETREAIKHLLKTGRSQRWIARELGVHRSTVKRYAKELTGSKCTISRTGKVGRPSRCEGYRQRIEKHRRLQLHRECSSWKKQGANVNRALMHLLHGVGLT